MKDLRQAARGVPWLAVRSVLVRALVLSGILLWVPGVMGLVFCVRWLTVPYKGYDGPHLILEIPPESSARDILHILEEAGVLRPSRFARPYLALTGRASRLQAGEYLFEGSLTPSQILDKLVRGEIYYHRITIPEGLRSDEIFRQFAARGFGTEEEFREAFRDFEAITDLDPEASDLEGYLFPDTYHLAKGTSALQIVQRMVTRHRDLWSAEWKARAEELGLTPREVVTLASLIEKETARAEERPLVSSVFHNRLRKGMKLQCDPTVIYALAMRSKYQGRISRRDLALDSRYNTYVYYGLPPGPIANPGREAIRASLYPERSKYLYFVSMNTGQHAFSTNLADHTRAVQRYQR